MPVNRQLPSGNLEETLSRRLASRATLGGMLDLLSDTGVWLLVMAAGAVFAAMAWVGTRVN